jgi:hypothetical protein
MRKLPKRDPIAAYARRVTAQRRIGEKKCVCGETRPQAFAKGKSKLCAKCKRKRRGETTMDKHHVAGQANNPTTIPIDVNDHRARLSDDQCDWPKQTRENPDGSPLIAGAGCLRGFVDTVVYLIERLVLWVADMLEKLDAYLVQKLGRKWWVKTELNQFAPKR